MPIQNALGSAPRTLAIVLSLVSASAVQAQDASPLVEARKDFETRLVREFEDDLRMPDPTEFGSDGDGFSLVEYPAPIGDLQGLLKVPDGLEGKRPAMVWVLGGLPVGGAVPNLFGDPDPDADDSAIQYDRLGMVTFYPSFRGSFGNPGRREGFLGEVDDLVAAVEFVKGLDFVDADHVYLGGHGFGATLALLAAETGLECRGVLCCGADADYYGYDPEMFAFDIEDEEEHKMRAPVEYLDGVRSKTLIIEGSEGLSIDLQQLAEASSNELISVLSIEGSGHGEHLLSTNALLAGFFTVAHASGRTDVFPPLSSIQAAYDESSATRLRAQDLRELADAVEEGVDLSVEHSVDFLVFSEDSDSIETMAELAASAGFDADEPSAQVTEEGQPYFLMVFRKKVVPSDLQAFFEVTEGARRVAREAGLRVEVWFLH